MTEDLRYPIGKFNEVEPGSVEKRAESIVVIATLPSRLGGAIDGLISEQLDTPYRPGGWTVRQTVHHLADSHLNSLCRFKLALTEDVPTIRPYFEDRWAELPDSRMPIDASMMIIEGVHARWSTLLASMEDADFRRRLHHPESGEWQLGRMLSMYAWHSLHHTAHINRLRERMGW